MQLVSQDFHRSIQGSHAKVSFYSAPGRVNLIGEHTDYNEGWVLPAAINRRCQMALSLSPSLEGDHFISEQTRKLIQSIYLGSREVPKKDTPPSDQEVQRQKAEDLFQLYCRAVVHQLRESKDWEGGILATFDSDIPMGAGLSTSAAICSLLAFGLNDHLQLGLPREELAQIAQRAEHLAGLNCGIMDQMAVLFGERDQALLIDCRDLQIQAIPAQLPGTIWILIDSGVRHELVSSAYNERRAACERVVATAQSQGFALQSLRDLKPQDLPILKTHLDPDDLLKAEYVLEENQRVLHFAKALQVGDADEIGRILFRAHAGMREKYRITCPELDQLVQIAALSEGVKGARMTGGGFGGCTLNLVEEEYLDNFLAQVAESYAPAKGNPIWYRVEIDPGCKKEDHGY